MAEKPDNNIPEVIEEVKQNTPEAIVFDVPKSNKPIRRGQIRYCKLDKLVDASNGLCIGKYRPCIIIQSNAWNDKHLATVGVIPLSHSPMYSLLGEPLYGLKLNASGIEADPAVSYIGLNRIMFISRWRVSTYICNCPKDVMKLVDSYLEKRLGLNKKKRRKETC